MGLRDRWIRGIFSVASGSRKVRLILTPLGALAFFSFAALFVLAAWAVDLWLALPRPIPEGWRLGAAIPFLVGGLLMIGWCNLHFARAKGTPVPLNPPVRLIDTGPYAVTRNPMLTGLFAVMFGVGVAMDSLSLMVLFTPLFALLNALEIRFIEEPELELRLGEPYREYRRRVPMFIPRIGPRRG